MSGLAQAQAGRITWTQLTLLGVAEATVRSWVRAGYLHRMLPGVYAVGHPGRTAESDLWEAILYAGPGAMLSHLSAAHWLGLISYPPTQIHVSTPRRCARQPRLVLHGRRELDRILHRGLPTTTPAQTVQDLAALGQERLVRKALAQLDFRHKLDVAVFREFCDSRRAGAPLLRQALARHEPLLARTKSELEDDWLIKICEGTGVPRPDDVNATLYGIECDVVYVAAKLVVELDGEGNHHSRAQLASDRAKERTLRSHGWEVRRYGGDEMEATPQAVHDDFMRTLQQRSSLPPDGGRQTDALPRQA